MDVAALRLIAACSSGVGGGGAGGPMALFGNKAERKVRRMVGKRVGKSTCFSIEL